MKLINLLLAGVLAGKENESATVSVLPKCIVVQTERQRQETKSFDGAFGRRLNFIVNLRDQRWESDDNRYDRMEQLSHYFEDTSQFRARFDADDKAGRQVSLTSANYEGPVSGVYRMVVDNSDEAFYKGEGNTMFRMTIANRRTDKIKARGKINIKVDFKRIDGRSDPFFINDVKVFFCDDKLSRSSISYGAAAAYVDKDGQVFAQTLHLNDQINVAYPTNQITPPPPFKVDWN